MTLKELQREAARKGYVLKPIPKTMKETLQAVEAGASTAWELADALGLKYTTACMRLSRAADLGLLDVAAPRRTVGRKFKRR